MEDDTLVPPAEYAHIPWHYYDQMIGYMAIFKKNWCDFMVYVEPKNQCFIQRIPFNPTYWKGLEIRIHYFLSVTLPERRKYHEERLKKEAKPVVNMPDI